MNAKVQAFLNNLLIKMEAASCPGRSQVLADIYDQVKRDGAYFRHGCWVSVG